MSKNQTTPSQEEMDLARAHAEVDEIMQDSGVVDRWIRAQAKAEIEAEQNARGPRSSRPSRIVDPQDVKVTFEGSDFKQRIDERLRVDYMGLLARVKTREVTDRAAAYPKRREAAAAAAAADRARNSCPLCGGYSTWGHRSRQLLDSGDVWASAIDSCLPCFLTAQRVWLELESRRVPGREAAVRSAVESLVERAHN